MIQSRISLPCRTTACCERHALYVLCEEFSVVEDVLALNMTALAYRDQTADQSVHGFDIPAAL